MFERPVCFILIQPRLVNSFSVLQSVVRLHPLRFIKVSRDGKQLPPSSLAKEASARITALS
jgi:hypothetical protein